MTTLVNLTTERRQAAVSYRKQYAFDMGPIARGDNSDGLMSRAWRLRVAGNKAYLAIANEENTTWVEEFLEFTLPHYPVWSVDLTFEQNGRPFICWEYQDTVWIYWYDSVIGSMQIREVCAGRTPRARLDARQRHQIPDSDIYLCYINDAANQMEYRIQRDRYNTVYPTNVVDTQNAYLEVLAAGHNYRLYIWLSEYVGGAKKYRIIYRHSAIYPYYFSEEVEILPDTVTSASHIFEFILWSLADAEVQFAGDSIVHSIIRAAIWEYEMSDEEVTLTGDSIVGAILRLAIFIHEVDDEDVSLAGDLILSGAIRQAILLQEIEDESITLSGDSILSASKLVV